MGVKEQEEVWVTAVGRCWCYYLRQGRLEESAERMQYFYIKQLEVFLI